MSASRRRPPERVQVVERARARSATALRALARPHRSGVRGHRSRDAPRAGARAATRGRGPPTPEIRMPAERDGHVPPAGGHDRGRHARPDAVSRYSTSMRCGNGNARRVDRRRRRARLRSRPRACCSVDLPPPRTDEQPVDRQAIAVSVHPSRRGGRRRHAQRGSAAARAGWPTARATAVRACARRAARPDRPASRGTRARRSATTRPSCRAQGGTRRRVPSACKASAGSPRHRLSLNGGRVRSRGRR